MSNQDHSFETIYEVVVNDERQHSIWPIDKIIPFGWEKVGKRGSKELCLVYIKEKWTDMRPFSLQKEMNNLLN